MSFQETQATVEGFSVKFHLPPAGVSLPRSFHTGQLHAGQCQLWSVCWCRCLPGSTVWQPRQREEGRESVQRKEVGSVVRGDGERREWNSEENQCEKLQWGENQDMRGWGSEIKVPEEKQMNKSNGVTEIQQCLNLFSNTFWLLYYVIISSKHVCSSWR